MRPFSSWVRFTLLFLFLFVFRTLFGLSLIFFGDTEPERDALQTYLIGLKFYTTGQWPYFGPDQYVMTQDFHTQIAGALEGFTIGAPFYVLPIPEAPFLLLNLLSLGALALLAFWIVRRLPNFSYAFVLTWIALLPWTLNRGTNILNPCFLVFGSVLFFIGFLEMVPTLTTRWLKPWQATAWMAFGLLWNMQFHLSWILLGPLASGIFLWRRKEKLGGGLLEVGGAVFGSILPLAFLLPTYLKFGLGHGPSGILHSFQLFHWDNFKDFFTVLARYLSFAAYEIPRFIGSGKGERIAFLNQAPWLWPPALFLFIVGLIQPFFFLLTGFFRDKERTGEARWAWGLTMGAFLWVWFCFWFTSTGTAAHMYFVFMPLVVVQSFFVWARLKGTAWKGFALACLIASLWLQTGVMVQKFKDRSLESHREVIVRALQERDYRLLGERRPGAFY